MPAEALGAEPNPLFDLSLEQLADVEVTSVAKKSQRLADAAAAIFVISGEDIRRAGVTSIPEALRLAPGIEVAKIDNNKWAITARGFNGRFANKLLVLMDGRSIYSPLFSGVHWDLHDTLLEDIERIEVIRGPGAALWGANAVNGVINIITRRAQETQGALLSVTAGSEERGNVGFRQGGTSDAGVAWRAYGKAFYRDAAVDASGSRANDAWRMQRAGFRADGKLDAASAFTVQGDVYRGSEAESVVTPVLGPPYAAVDRAGVDTRGLNLVGRLTRPTDSGEMTVQAYYDGSRFESVVLSEDRDTLDLDFQHRLPRLGRHDVIWGLGYRINRDRTRAGIAAMLPPDRSDRLFSAFLQDEIAVGDTLKFTLGSKLEHNDYSGWEIQPSLRAWWKPAASQSAWASVSRAVRTPSRGDAQARIDVMTAPGPSPGMPLLVQAVGNEGLDSERLMAYELGWRFSPNPAFALDFAAFLNDYDHLRSQEAGTSLLVMTPLPHLVQTVTAGNLLKGRTWGFELVLEARPAACWRLLAAYSNLHFDLEARPGSGDRVSVAQLEGSSPRQQFSLRSEWNVDPQTEFDAWLKHVGSLPALGIPGYASLNVRLAWRPRRDLEVALVGQNLLDDHHPEFRPEFVSSLPSEVQRAFHATVRFRF